MSFIYKKKKLFSKIKKRYATEADLFVKYTLISPHILNTPLSKTGSVVEFFFKNLGGIEVACLGL